MLLNPKSYEKETSFYWSTLGEVCNISTGQALDRRTILPKGNFPFVNAGIEPSGYVPNKNTEGESITIPSRGQGGAGHVGYQKTDFWCGPLCYKIQSKNDNLLTRYVYYYLKGIQNEIVNLRQTGSIPAVNRKELVLIKIPIFPLDKQNNIVSILDKFDSLLKDISIGLPAELKARRSQYEYYRGKLLTFNEYVN